jgi:hypothetical protein
MVNPIVISIVVALSLTVIISRSIAAESTLSVNQPQLTVNPSNYVTFNSSNVVVSKDAITFEGTFVVLGEGIYGHFDLVTYDDSGKSVQLTKTDDQAFMRDHGSKPKPIILVTGNSKGITKVEVSFHEMRLNPDTGACISK